MPSLKTQSKVSAICAGENAGQWRPALNLQSFMIQSKVAGYTIIDGAGSIPVLELVNVSVR